MNQSEHNLLAVVAAPQCIRGFLQLYPALRTAISTAFKIDYLKGNRDDALYWQKQGTALGKMKRNCESALQFAPEPSARYGTGSQSFAHLGAPSVFRTAFEVAKESITDLVTHYNDFVKALQMEKEFFLDPAVYETLLHERPQTEAVLNALQDLRNLASAILEGATVTSA